MADITHYARARKSTEAVGDGDQRAGLEAQLAVSTAIREVSQTIRQTTRDLIAAIEELPSALAAVLAEDGAK